MSKEKSKTGDYFETVSLSNKDIKTNIENNYKVGTSITRLSLLEELKEQVDSNLMIYSNNYLMSEPRDGYEVEWKFELQKSKLLNEMIKDEKNKDKLYKKDKEWERL